MDKLPLSLLSHKHGNEVSKERINQEASPLSVHSMMVHTIFLRFEGLVTLQIEIGDIKPRKIVHAMPRIIIHHRYRSSISKILEGVPLISSLKASTHVSLMTHSQKR